MNMRSLIPWGRSNNQQAPTQYRSNEQDPVLSLQRDMNRLFDDVFRSFDSRLPSMGALGSFGSFGAPWPSVEITDTDKEIRVMAEVPGLEENDIEVLLDGDVLTLRGEKPDLVPTGAGAVHLLGYSLGSGLALHVAAHREVASVLLEAPFASLCAVMTRKAWAPGAFRKHAVEHAAIPDVRQRGLDRLDHPARAIRGGVRFVAVNRCLALETYLARFFVLCGCRGDHGGANEG